MRTTPIGRLVIDTADALGSARTMDDRWTAIMRIAGQIGAEAVNIGGFNTSINEICWVRSTKDPLWLEQYEQADFATVDPLIQGAVTGKVPQFIDIAEDEKRRPASGELRDWRATSLSYGYNYLIGRGCIQGVYGTGVALSCREDPMDLFGPGTMRAFSAISTMIASSLLELSDPEENIHEGWAYGARPRSLLAEERDVLALLANGLPEYMIADVLNITEFEVWRHIRVASLKMRAETKEQALAVAISRGLVQL